MHRWPYLPFAWRPCCLRTIQRPLAASPCGRLSRPRSTTSQSDFHPIISPFSPHRLGRSYKLALEPDGSPLFPLTPLVACWRYEPREHPRPLALARPAIPPSPLSDRVGYSDHVRFRGYLPVHWCSGLQPPCLRFAAAVTGRHARLGTRLLARLCRRRHLRRLSSTRLQGATLIEPDWRIARIRLSDKTSRLHPRRATTKLGQAYEAEVLVKVREWISSALASPDLVLEAQPPAQPHSRVVVERPIRLAGGSNPKVVGPSAERLVQLIHQPCGLLPGTRSVGQRVGSFDHALDALL